MNISLKKINILGTKEKREESEESEVKEYLAFFRAKQQLMYTNSQENIKNIYLDKIPKDIFDNIFSYIPEYIITWLSDNTWTIKVIQTIKDKSLYEEYLCEEYRNYDYDDYDNYYYEDIMIREVREDDERDREDLRELYSIQQLRLDNSV